MWQAKKISAQNRDFRFFLFCPSLHPNNKIHTKNPDRLNEEYCTLLVPLRHNFFQPLVPLLYPMRMPILTRGRGQGEGYSLLTNFLFWRARVCYGHSLAYVAHLVQYFLVMSGFESGRAAIENLKSNFNDFLQRFFCNELFALVLTECRSIYSTYKELPIWFDEHYVTHRAFQYDK